MFNRLFGVLALVALTLAFTGQTKGGDDIDPKGPPPATSKAQEEILKVLKGISDDVKEIKADVAVIKGDIAAMKGDIASLKTRVTVLETRPATATVVRVVNTTSQGCCTPAPVRSEPYCGCVARGYAFNTCGNWTRYYGRTWPLYPYAGYWSGW